MTIFKKVLEKVLRDQEIMEMELQKNELPEFRIKLVYLGACQRYLKNARLL